MKKNNILILVVSLLSLTGAAFIAGCGDKTPTSGGEHGKDEISHYTCPMHPHIHSDKPGECPICHMDLVPVYKQGTTPSGGSSLNISPERQQLIGIKTQMAVKKEVAQEIRTVGRVAFDPDLAVAQREFLEIAKNVPSLKPASVSRLRLLGMGEEEIRDLERRGKITTNLYLPKPGESVWIYATLYQSEVGVVKIGDKAIITLPTNQARRAIEGEAPAGFARGGGDASPYEGFVRGVDPVLDPMTRSARARIEVSGAAGLLRPDSYVNVSLKINLGQALTVPKSAVIDTGARQVAFVLKDDRNFDSRPVKIGPEVGDQEVVVLEGLQEGDKVVSSAAFFVDSESQLKAAVSGPSCPEGQAWDAGMAMCMPKVGS